MPDATGLAVELDGWNSPCIVSASLTTPPNRGVQKKTRVQAGREDQPEPAKKEGYEEPRRRVELTLRDSCGTSAGCLRQKAAAATHPRSSLWAQEQQQRRSLLRIPLLGRQQKHQREMP